MKVIGVNLLSFDCERLTGVGYFFKRLFEALPGTIGLEFVIFCQESFPFEQVVFLHERISWRRVTVPRFRSRFRRILYEQCALPFLCRGVDVLFSPCVANPLLRLGYRTVSTIHDLTPFFVGNKYGVVQHLYVKAITRLLARYSSSVITVSENSRSDLIRVLGVNASKIQVVYNVVPEHSSDKVSYNNFFLAVGTRQPGKNLSGVIQAFSVFCKKHDTQCHQLKIVGGSGWGGDECANLVSKLGMQDRIQFMGYLPEEELSAMYRGCKGLILLSLYEGFGIPVLEALAWNKPSVVSNLSALPEVVGNTGIQVNPLDYEAAALAIKAIAEDPQAHLKGRDIQLARFSPVRQSATFLKILDAEAEKACG